ncbi:MAG: T9SS type A sorting domain-containing protein [Ferruginibacter sp.]
MKKIYLLFFIAICSHAVFSQTIVVSGQCMSGSIVLNPIGNIDGKPAYEGTGTVDGNPGVQINIFWMPAPDNLWVLAYDGQPYFQNSCITALPWETGNPSCAWTAVSGQTCTGPNPLNISGTGTLPVTITDFTAKVNSKQIIVAWKTSSENNNKGFEIQRSSDGISWKAIGFINGGGNSSIVKNYQFSDKSPFQGINFYRLRQVDLDGKYLYSTVASVKFLKAGFYSISGNAVTNIYQVNIESTNVKVDLSLVDATGKRLISKKANAGFQTINISSFPAGIYLLRIQKGTEMFIEKLIKF